MNTLMTPITTHKLLLEHDQAPSSSVATRRPSRLNAMVSRRAHFSKPMTAVAESEHSSLHRVQLNQLHQSGNSAYSGYHGNYKLSRVESHRSLASAFEMQTRYRVMLDLSPKEISLLRYMWNRMLGEELVEEPAAKPGSALPLPGSLWAQAKEKPVPSTPRHALGALSLFCSQLYSNLLTMDPGLEIAFPLLRHQAVLMAGVLSLAVNSLENLMQLDDYLVELGNRHSRILGIEPAQFELMGEAFIQTFHERFGARFTHELEVLWIKFYMYLANSLLQLGLDPVMRADYTADPRISMAELAVELIFTAESDDLMTMNNSVRREYTTDISSMASAIKMPIAGFGKRGSMDKGGVALALAQASQPVRTKKKRGRLGRAKGDCTIM